MGSINTIPSKRVGEHMYFPSCRFCGSKRCETVIDLGIMPLAGGFIKPDSIPQAFEREKNYPLTIAFCEDCYLLQCNTAVSPETLFKDYFYFSSSIGTLLEHFDKTVSEIATFIPEIKGKMIMEIGCNDGGFLQSLKKHGYKALGIDPATNVVTPMIKKGLPIINDFFTEKLAKKIVKEYGKADAIYSFHSMAHIEDMHDVIRGVKTVLQDDGYLAFEVHYLGSLLKELQYDMMYHEHEYYYSLHSLTNFFAQHDMEIFHVNLVPVRGGSIQYFVQKKLPGSRKVKTSVTNLYKKEKEQGLHKKATYKKFGKKIAKTKKDLLILLNTLKKGNKTIVGYGASGRGTVVMNYCGLTSDYLSYVVDDAKAKHGSYTPGTHLEIKPSGILMSDPYPDYAVVFAWPFMEEVKKRNPEFLARGGKFITPLPEVKIIL